MELDMTEYDQVDDTKLMLENPQHEHLCCDAASSSKFLVTLSSTSCSDQNSVEEAETNCENDFVFLPAPTKPFVFQRQTQPKPISSSDSSDSTQESLIGATSTRSQPTNQLATFNELNLNTQQAALNDLATTTTTNYQQQVVLNHPLTTISTNNPFGNYQQDYQGKASSSEAKEEPTKGCTSKPIGLLEVLPAINTNPNKLADLMQQIVTRSDMIFIAIPCAYCHEPIACPPSDISSWLNHMSRQHNCKLCPICNRIIGLGPKREIEIMKKHVLEHLDEDWLERRAAKVSFTFGLQQQWFSGNRCSVKDPRYR